jgi:cell division protein FtsI/penicillin-binding protein 2/cell division protein FtsW (lipid II flippase)
VEFLAMVMTRQTYAAARGALRGRERGRNRELALLAVCSLAVLCALVLVYRAKSVAPGETAPLVLTSGATAAQIAERLSGTAPDRQFAARRIVSELKNGAPENVGALGRITVGESEVPSGLDSYPRRIEEARVRRAAREEAANAQRTALGRWWHRLTTGEPGEIRIPLLTPAELAAAKPLLAVRTHAEFKSSFLRWAVAFFLAFYIVHAAWRWRRFAGDDLILPAVHLASGIGLALMLSLRDPVRDTLMFANFAQGIVLGCGLLLLLSLVDFERQASRFSYVWLMATVLLAAALALFGSGPGTSDARVNLLFFQPVEAMRILLVLFLAGYFGRNWDALRELRQQHGRFAPLARALHIARFDYTLPVFAGVAVALALFFFLKDMGPALVAGAVFLGLYSIARNSFRLALAGFAAIVLGIWIGYVIGVPHTVAGRIDMWLSAWDNPVRGGDQLAHSLWSLATGGLAGTGLGQGSSSLIPAGHTDLIFSVLGEQLGFLGLLAIAGVYLLLVWRSVRIALRAEGAYSFFLVIGLTLVTALQVLLIAGGILGLVPLTGVVSPFLSFGRSSMMANFALFGIILAVSNRPAKDQRVHFGQTSRVLAMAASAAAVVILARAAWVQVIRPDETLVRGALVVNADGVRRYEYNPRLMQVARRIPRGDIYDRNGLPLATSDWFKVQAHAAEYKALGVDLEETAQRAERRHYPLGAPLFYLLGDTRSGLKQGASNTTFEERASRMRLQGYDDAVEVEATRDPETNRVVHRLKYDYSELVPLLRHRNDPDNPEVKRILQRERDLHMSIDARLEMRVAGILERNLKRLGRTRGAIVVLEPSTGDLLASVSYPWPSEAQLTGRGGGQEAVPEEELLDRARYGLYPPGSSFKLVTAMAALKADPSLASERFQCIRLPGGRVGNYIKGFGKPIRDDVQDKQPHGSVDLARGIIYSCNAYFAQLGTYRVGAKRLFEMAREFGISVAAPATPEQLQKSLPQSSYGQGQVVATPFQMARVAATIANGGVMPLGRWILDESNPRVREPQRVLSAPMAAEIAAAMRAAVTQGTGKAAAKSPVAIAGKTGTAELARGPSHAWFIGFAPYRAGAKGSIAFAILVENGRYGGTAAAPMAAEVVAAARELGLIKE